MAKTWFLHSGVMFWSRQMVTVNICKLAEFLVEGESFCKFGNCIANMTMDSWWTGVRAVQTSKRLL